MGLSQFPPAAGGIPTGNTAARPASPVIGDVYYNGQKAILEIYDGTNWIPCSAPAAAPTIAVADVGTSVAYGSAQGAVTITPNTSGGPADSYLISASTGGYTATTSGTTVTITVGNNGSWTFSGQGINNFGTSVAGTSVTQTLTTVPQAPTIGSASTSSTTTDVIVTWTLGNNGGKDLTSITITPYLNGTTAGTPQTAATTSSTSHAFTGLTQGSAYTFKVKTANANGTGLESSATNSITVPSGITIDYLVIAGGAGGGGGYGGGGGAGGYRTSFSTSGGGASAETSLFRAKSTNYTVTVGGGGAAGAVGYNATQATNGENSVFDTITSTGGGRGGNTVSGNSGGSGGGGMDNGTGGTGTTGQGYSGGAGSAGGAYGAGGGGGAGAAGVAGNTSAGGNGGNGVASSITGSSVTRGGGGGGGVYLDADYGLGGTGGGGDAGPSGSGQSGNGTSGTTNTGGGGGGASRPIGSASYTQTPGAGGRGVVILRWLTSAATITVGAGLTADATGTDGSYSYKVFTAGTGNVSFS